jgi:hypothetical protein
MKRGNSMKSKKRTTKAVTLLTRVETLLSDVLEECSDIEKSVEKNIRVLLRSAEASIAVAKDYFTASEPSKVRRKTATGRVSRHRVARSRVKAPATKKRSIGPAARPA